jgi:hypothetical protein
MNKLEEEEDDDDKYKFDEDDENYEEEFEKLLDKDDEQSTEKKENPLGNPKLQNGDAEHIEDDDEYIDDDEMLDVAEHCFKLISHEILKHGVTIREAFSNFIIEQEVEGEVMELLSPIGFLEGIKDLGIVDLEEV